MFARDLKTRLENVHAFAATPFNRENLLELDLDDFVRNLEFMIERGVQVIAVGGGTGEINALSVSELETLAQTALETAGDRALVIPALPGNLRDAGELAPRYERMGARVALGMAPFIRDLVPQNLEGVFQYFRLLSQASGLALLPYNTQGWPADFFARLAEIDPIIGIKDPCFDPHELFRAMRRLGDRFVWIGNKRHDPGVLHFRFQAGIDGFTAGLVNFIPEFELELYRTALRQDWDRMIVLQEQLAPLERLRNQYKEGLIKAGLDLVGLAGGPVRPPRVDTPPAGRAALAAELRKLGVEIRQDPLRR